MKKYVVIEKQVGETPLAALESYRTAHPELADIPMAYAGRLDPMASGKLLVLIGEECKKQTEYHGLDKEYEFEILFDFKSDTGDILGLATHQQPPKGYSNVLKNIRIKDVVRAVPKELELPYPLFSSKTVQGKPLFLWTLENRLNEIEIPVAHSKIFKLSYKDFRSISGRELKESILEKIDLIPTVTEPSKALGEDFRREKIRARWHEILNDRPEEEFVIAKYSTIVSSGTYIRSLAPYIAELLGTTGLAYSIHRTRIGQYHGTYLKVPLWLPSFVR